MRWDTSPLAPVAGAFALGIAGAAFVPGTGHAGRPALLWSLWAGAIALGVAFGARRRHRIATLAALAAVAAVGLLHASPGARPAHHVAAQPLPLSTRIEGRLAAEPIRLSPDRYRLLVEADAMTRAGARRPVTGLVQLTLYGEPASVPAQGQAVAADARLAAPRSFRNPGGFDYAAHLARQDIHVVGSGRGDRLTAVSPGGARWSTRIRRWAGDRVRAALPPVSAALLAGLLLGERTDLPSALDDTFRRAGVYHILAVSGFNVALLTLGVFAVLAVARIPRRAAAVAAIVAAVGFAQVVGGGASVLRATVMAVLALTATVLGREANLMNSIAAAALLILALRPGDLAEPGFQLSFGATLGIVLLAPAIRSPLVARGCPAWLAEAVAISASAQLFVVPIMLAHFNQLALIAVGANLLVVPLAAVATVAGMLALAAGAVSDGLGRVLLEGLWPVLLALRASAFVAAQVPGGLLHLPAPHWVAITAFYTGLAVLAGRRRPRAEGRRDGPPLPVPRPRPRVATAAALCLSVAVIVAVWPLARPASGRLRVTFLDVGQGDAIALELPDGRAAVVDAGPGGPARFDTGERVVAPYLWNRGIRRLALAVATHADVDHAGGIPAVLRLFGASLFWSAAHPPPAAPLFLGGVGISILGPPRPPLPGSARGAAADRNNGSVVLRLDYGLTSLLLAGDIEDEAERHLLARGAPLRADVLKVGHHGARSSSSDAFLARVSPSIAVISAGARNPFGHPSDETLDRLRRAGARIYRTDRDGAVTIESDGRELSVTTWADGRPTRLSLTSGTPGTRSPHPHPRP